jgi:1,4-alpha-glucan branching enzyme
MNHAKLEAPPKGSVAEVPFVVRARGARQVSITGDFTGWSKEGLPLRKAPSGEWRTVLELRPGEYQYRLVIDGEWSDDPQATRRVSNPFGGENCILQVGDR